MLPRWSRASASSRIARKAEKAQGSRFSLKFARLQAIDEGDKGISDDIDNEAQFVASGEDTNELDEWSGEVYKYKEEDAASTQHDEDHPEPQSNSEGESPKPSYQEPFNSEAIANYYNPLDLNIGKSSPRIDFAPNNLLPGLEHLSPLDEPASTVAARSRNLHTRATISDDRSEDSDIKARFLLALRSRNENSPQPPLPSSDGAVLPPQSPEYAAQNYALQDYQMQSMLLEQQNKKRLMMARQKKDSMMGLSPSMATAPTSGSSRPIGYTRPQGQIANANATSDPRQEYQERGFPATRDLSRTSAITPMHVEQQFVDWMYTSGPNTGPNHPKSDGRAYPNDVLGFGLDMEAETANFLDGSTTQSNPGYHPSPRNVKSSSEDLENLLAHIEVLQKTSEAMKIAKREREPPEYKILHRLGFDDSTSVYLDAPQWVNGQKNSKVLKSSLPLWDVEAYLEQHPSVAFIVYRHYDKSQMTTAPESDGDVQKGDAGIAPEVQHTKESISIISQDLVLALSEFLKTIGGFTEIAHAISQYQEIPSPYLFIYHSRNVVHHYLGLIPDQRRNRMSCLLKYVHSTCRDEYQEVDALLQRRKIRVQYIQYLFRMGEVVIERKDNSIRGICSSSEISNSNVRKTWNEDDDLLAEYSSILGSMLSRAEQWEKPKKKNSSCSIHTWKLSAWSWKFDGAFSRVKTSHELTLEVRDKQEQSEVDIDSLNLFPLSFADEATKALLQKRGEMFWKCRFKHLVSYRDEDNSALDRSADERFMIDLMTYRELHKAHAEEKKGQVPEPFTDDLGSQAMKQENPPDEKFVYLLPLSMKGFNLQRKRWVDLEVDRMYDVVWNKKAFKSLVLEEKTKDLLEALIRNQLDSEKSTDLIHGKGNGLILLLHGGPGTGKTLTAESVAEIAEKPLYRVTCGDIGTEPDEVEPYLESVLHLGKIWKGVVLLDEADVFLEQRSLGDLRRNALVSIFLRVLEYYDGILVLTSNRVGTFDEAFKSRIQLALHYPKLDRDKRAKVWENFIARLHDLKEENIDFSDLRDNVLRLAENKMNGREIRNAITLARQYTQWKKMKLNFAELQDIIKISGQFDIYLSELNSNVTQDQLAQEEGLRLAEADK
ncbi:hypothetical protein BKA65DRAFT_507096 [Rhexocercosporidium sp. MPI-PUGE-AT-0058]|nr:hypothetical protein BKA65DRAFT_507096 [Rhexocercosporidium sp. MPI-PUGE-AT-0058]